MNDDSSQRIVNVLRRQIASAAPGSRLPSTRALVAEHHASPVTVQTALRRLAGEGLLESRTGVGTFVRSAPVARVRDHGWQTTPLGPAPSGLRGIPDPLRDAPSDAAALHSGYPDRALLPERLVRTALARAARSEVSLTRPPVAGAADLRTWFAGELAASCLPGVAAPSATDVVILPGSQSGLSSIFRTLVGVGRPVVMESPTYWGALTAAAHAGVAVVPVGSGPLGPDPADVARALDETGARFFYAQPSFANPTGAHWSRALATEILDIVRARDAFLIEDDWAHDFGIDASVLPLAAADDAGHVIHLRSLTKSVSPALRVAGMTVRGPARERIVTDVAAESMYVSGVLQAAALDIVTQPAWRTHLRSLPERLRSRRDLLLEALRTHAPSVRVDAVPTGGLSLWVRLPDGADAERVAAECARSGVHVAVGDAWFPTEPPAAYLRLGYAGPDPSGYADAARVLAAALATSA